MKGTVIDWKSRYGYGFVATEDGREFFLHESEVENTKKIRVGNIITFDVVDEEKKTPRAVHARKTGHGKCHPFCRDLEALYADVERSNIEEPEKGYRLRDIKKMYEYFEKVEDYEQYSNIRNAFKDCKEGA
jgi:cold shock CspA family protein